MNDRARAALSAFLFLGVAARADAQETRDWTFLFYGMNDNSSEESVMGDLAMLREGLADGQGVEVIALVDRSPEFSKDAEALGSDFDDTRLFRLTHDKAEPLDGGAEMGGIAPGARVEVDTGDPRWVKRFVHWGKAHYPARHYALVFYTHGNGAAFGPDDSAKGDMIFAAELSTALDEEDSVDLLGFDVCSMGGVENAYQWRAGKGRFGAAVMVASAPSTAPWPYRRIFARLRRPGVATLPLPELAATVDPAHLDAREFGTLLVNELETHRAINAKNPKNRWVAHESWAAYDLTQVDALKSAIDELAAELATAPDAKELVTAIRGRGAQTPTPRYFDGSPTGWLAEPFFDLFDLATRIAAEAKLPEGARLAAQNVADCTDAVVLASFGGADYPGFEPGRDGLSITFPDGDAVAPGLGRHWSRLRWYNAGPVAERPDSGNLAFCRDGAVEGDGIVQGWFELLDSWFDTANGATGGDHGWRW